MMKKENEQFIVMRMNQRTDEWDQLSKPLDLNGAIRFKGFSETTYKGVKLDIFYKLNEKDTIR